MSAPNKLEMSGISKRYGGVHALRSVSLEAVGGEVHALLGENGAGKSSLMKVLSGASRPDEGAVRLDGELLDLSDPQAARDRGVAVIYQEFSLAPHLTVAENIFIDDLAFGSRVIRWPALRRRAREQLALLGFDGLDPMTPVAHLSVAQQQIVEICKALRREPRVVVFDEPTAVLTERETERLFELIGRLRERGVCIIYVSHRLEEVFRLCTRATILKDGRNAGSVRIADIDKAGLIQMMVGRELKDLFPQRRATISEIVLDVRNLSVGGRVNDVSFDVRGGEVVGFYGLIGAGRTETMRAIFGADRRSAGEIRLAGIPVQSRSPKDAILSGIGMLPEDRKQHGLLLDFSLRVNAMLRPRNPAWSRAGRIDHRRERAQTSEVMRALRIKARDSEIAVGSLSGGNQQKVALARWVFSDCRVLILDEPTRGVDVGAKVEIYGIINEMAERGIGVVVVSSELPELIGLCDRILVVREGRLVGETAGDAMNERHLVALAMGVQP